MSQSNQSLRLCLRLALWGVATMPTVLSAQQVAPPPVSDEAPEGGVTEIVVTAQKREQRLQDVPIVVTALSGQLLRDTGVDDIKALEVLTPGLNVTSTTSETVTTARIRGIGTVGDNPGLESSVGVVIDGVYRPRNGVSFGDIGELERIEVLKGPQGTLFGKNTSAGVINVITKQPQFSFGTDAELTAGNYNAYDASGSITGPLVADKLAGRLFVTRGKRDGFLDVSPGAGPRTETEDATRDFYSVRGQLLFTPTSDLEIRLIADYSEREEFCCGATQVIAGPTAPIVSALSVDGGLANPADPFERQAFLNRNTPQDIEDTGVSAELNWYLPGLGGATLTSISAWRDWQIDGGFDIDYSSADIAFRAPDGGFGNQFTQLSQEIRLAGEKDRLSWLIGAFYAKEDLDSRLNFIFGSALEPYYGLLFSQGTAPTLISSLSGLAPGSAYPVDSGQADQYFQESDNYSLFTNNSLRITDKLEATLGVRYTTEEKSLRSQYANIGGGDAGCAALRANLATVNAVFGAAPAGTVENFYAIGCGTYADPGFNGFNSLQEIDEDDVSGTLKFAYRVNEDFVSYLSYARGYKAGGFNLDRERVVGTLGPADPNSTPDPDTSFDSETVDSYELGAKSSWLDNQLLLNATAFYQEFNDFQLNAFNGINFIVTSVPEVTSQGVDLDFVWAPVTALSFQGGVTYADTEYGEFVPPTGVSARLSGGQISFAPKWSGTLAATYSQPISDTLLWRANIGTKIMSSYNTGSDLNPEKEQAGFALFNARLGLGRQDGVWAVEAWGLNLTDKDYYQVVIDAPLQPGTFNAFLGAPRTYGVTVRMSF
jgi:iron complex outermembrane recepter protein